MAAKSEQSEIVKRALAMLHNRPEPTPNLSGEGGTGEFKPTTEALAVSVLVETEPHEVGQILAIWQKVFGMTLDREQVAKHLERLRQWQSRWAG